MHTSEDTKHPSLAIVVAGILHAVLEDWMFAPNNHLFAFFGNLVSRLHDFDPSSLRSIPALRCHPEAVQAAFSRITVTA
jgi:hypothetical protein